MWLILDRRRWDKIFASTAAAFSVFVFPACVLLFQPGRPQDRPGSSSPATSIQENGRRSFSVCRPQVICKMMICSLRVSWTAVLVRSTWAGSQNMIILYWSHRAVELLESLNAEKTLTSQLCPDAFSLQQSPIWQDSSTTEECKILNDAVGGEQALADLTGSRAYERFTASQILKVLAPPSTTQRYCSH